MCSYDNMTVTLIPQRTKIVAKNIKFTRNSSSYAIKRNILQIIESTRLIFLLYLLVSPVYGSPFILPNKRSSSHAKTLTVRHSHRGHPKVGIGIKSEVKDLPSNQETLYNILPTGLQGIQGLPLSSSSYSSSQRLKEAQRQVVSSPLRRSLEALSKKAHYSLPNIYSNQEGSQLLSISSVPKASSHQLLRFLEAPESIRLEYLDPSVSDSQRSSYLEGFAMQEEDSASSASSSGRERRATAATPSGSGSGRGEWMQPCPNLDSKLDTNATPQSLSPFILRAIHEAKSQVDKFINEFARETFQSDSWEGALPEFQDYSFPFLNNTNSIDLNAPEELSFEDALQEAYELMQRRAVGIEQVTLDQALYQANFLTEFRHVEDRIVHVLCELRHAMIQSGVTPKQEVTKDVMKEEARDIDGERWRNIRDAVILREYITGLQMLHSLFSYYASDSQ
ncbi:UNVERIFIED_CONTAM: hypothetical protein RMT77_000906 [Armadillidium vulgare]